MQVKPKRRVCLTCQTEYDYCNNCQKDRHKETWHVAYCSKNCRDIFHAASDYFFGIKTKEETQEALLKCDLSKLDEFNPIVKSDVKAILDEPKKEEEIKPISEVKIEPAKAKFMK